MSEKIMPVRIITREQQQAANEQILPIASKSTLGAIKVGDTLQIDESGLLDVIEKPDIYPIANKETLGCVKVGKNINVTSDGIIWAPIATDKVLGVIRSGGDIEVLSDGSVKVNDSHYVLKPATKSTLGGIIVGDNLDINEEGVLRALAKEYELPIATSDILGGIKIGNNVVLTADGTLNLNLVTANTNGLMGIDDKIKLDGIEEEANKYILPTATTSRLGGVKQGTNVTIAADGTISVINGGGYVLPTASTTVKGGIKVGQNLNIDNEVLNAIDTTYNVVTTTVDGLMSAADKTKLDGIQAGANKYVLPVATTSILGGVKQGANVSIASDGTLSANITPYSLPTASTTVKGGIKVGQNLSMNGEVLNAKDTTYSNATTSATGLMSAADKTKLDGIQAGANKYVLPVATSSILGGVKQGANVTIAADGTLSANITPYSLPTASTTVKGGIKVGENLSMNGEVLNAKDTTYNVVTTSANGLMSAADKTKLDSLYTDKLILNRNNLDFNNRPEKNRLSILESDGSNTANAPSTNWHHTYTLQGSDTNYATQFAIEMSGNGEIYVRIKQAGTWGDWRKLSNTFSTNLPVGSIFYFTKTTPPDDCLVCNGAEVSRTAYKNLFNVIGTAFGAGNGTTTFNVPNLINRVPWGNTEVAKVQQAGIPNITGIFGMNNTSNCNGAFRYTQLQNSTDAAVLNNSNAYSFNAARGEVHNGSYRNDVYGKSDTVQPPALNLLPVIKF